MLSSDNDCTQVHSGGEESRLTVGQDIKALLAAHEVIDGLFDSGHIAQVNVEEL